MGLMLEYFHPWPNSAGFYLARERGWYGEAGIDLEVSLHDPHVGDTLEYLSQGRVDVGVFPTNRLLVRRDRGEPLVGVAAINHRALDSIQTLTRVGISRPRDLSGRRVAYNPTPRGRAMVRFLVETDGGDPDAVVTVDAGWRELTPSDIAGGRIDATFGGYWSWEALMADASFEDHLVWPVDEIGAPRYHSYLLGCREELLGDRADLVRAFLAVTERGT